MWVGGMMFCMSGCVAVSCHRTHMNTPPCELVCVSPTLLTVKQQGLKRIKPINGTKKKAKMFPFPQSPWVVFFFIIIIIMFWFIGLSARPLLFLLRTSKPLGGALDNGSHCSACPPSAFPLVSLLKADDCRLNKPVRSFPHAQTCRVDL